MTTDAIRQLTQSLQNLSAKSTQNSGNVSAQLPNNISSSKLPPYEEAEKFLKKIEDYRASTKDVRLGKY